MKCNCYKKFSYFLNNNKTNYCYIYDNNSNIKNNNSFILKSENTFP